VEVTPEDILEIITLSNSPLVAKIPMVKKPEIKRDTTSYTIRINNKFVNVKYFFYQMASNFL